LNFIIKQKAETPRNKWVFVTNRQWRVHWLPFRVAFSCQILSVNPTSRGVL